MNNTMNIFKISILFVFLWTILSCDTPQNNSNKDMELALEVVDCQVFEQHLKMEDTFILLDVRTKKEVDKGMIEGAKHLDFFSSDFTTSLEKLDKDQPILVYCAKGGRSNKAANQMVELGFRKVYDLDGGYIAWSTCNLD